MCGGLINTTPFVYKGIIWGVREGTGQNELGKILMRVRDELVY